MTHHTAVNIAHIPAPNHILKKNIARTIPPSKPSCARNTALMIATPLTSMCLIVQPLSLSSCTLVLYSMHILDIVVVVCENSPLIYIDGVTLAEARA